MFQSVWGPTTKIPQVLCERGPPYLFEGDNYTRQTLGLHNTKDAATVYGEKHRHEKGT